MITRFSIMTVAWLVVCGSQAHAQDNDCYTVCEDIGCDPENYGYEEEACPTVCLGGEETGSWGCTATEGGDSQDYFLEHGDKFDDMDYYIQVWDPADTALTGREYVDDDFQLCLTEGTCDCIATWRDPNDPFAISFECHKQPEYFWEEYTPILGAVCMIGTGTYDCANLRN